MKYRSKKPSQILAQNRQLDLPVRSKRSNENAKASSCSYETPFFFSHLAPAKITEVYDTYWRFAAERQEIFFRRLHDEQPPWTRDPILNKFKFTNAYRASDRASQYLIKNVIYQGDDSIDETFFRTILFKTFNKIETWELLTNSLGPISFRDYSFKHYDKILTKSLRTAQKIYSAAYIIASGKRKYGHARKHQNHLRLIEQMMEDRLPSRIAHCTSMQQVFDLLHSYFTIGDFLAYQYAIDLNYSELTSFSEMEFVVPGPGALDGIRKCFSDPGGLNEIDIIKLMADRQYEEFARLGLTFQSLWGRPLQLIDCQNLFCEVGKYARIAHPAVDGLSGRKKIKQLFKPNHHKVQPFYPPKWGLQVETLFGARSDYSLPR
jgi:hypothetical protein